MFVAIAIATSQEICSPRSLRPFVSLLWLDAASAFRLSDMDHISPQMSLVLSCNVSQLASMVCTNLVEMVFEKPAMMADMCV